MISAVPEVERSPADAIGPVEARVRCMGCGTEAVADGVPARCAVCGGLLDVVIPLDRRVRPEEFGVGLPGALRHSGVWRYRALLPPLPEAAIVSRWEGNTPLYVDDRLADYAGLAPGNLSFKHEGHNPTASFKDRGMTVGVSHARAVGARIVACASTGNTSASLASYAAAAGLPALVLVPEGKISGGKLAQTLAYGARVVQVAGDFDQALALLRRLVDAYDVYLVNSVNPFRLEGQKTIAFELIEQLGWQPPDVIVLPGGNLGNTGGVRQGAGRAERGRADRPAAAAGRDPGGGRRPLRRLRRERLRRRSRRSRRRRWPRAIKIGNPASTARARRAIEQTDGIVTTVSDDEILEAKAAIDRVGIGCEPASAASLAGVRRLVGEGKIGPEERAVCVLTGHVLKDPDAVVDYHLRDHLGAPRPGANRPISVAAELPALERALADALHG